MRIRFKDRPPRRSPHWTTGWLAGVAVVGVAARLLVTLIRLARQIAEQADEISAGLQRTAHATDALWNVGSLNIALQRTVRAAQAPITDPAGNTDDKERT